MTDLLFVYGTLRSGCDNAWSRRLREESEFLGPATVMGSIFRVAAYPGYREQPAGEVHGEVYRPRDPVRLLAMLDDYEDEDFERVPTQVSTGQTAWIYRHKPEPDPDTRIVSGDFLAR